MIVTQSVTQTPFLAGKDPFERFPQAAVTTTDPRGSPLLRESSQRSSVLESISTVLAALSPTTSSQPSAAALIASLADRFQVTLANFAESLPLLGFGALSHETTDARPQQAVARGSAVRALAASGDLGEWLGLTEEQVADLAGFSRRNYSNWRAGQGSYLKTVRELFEIHALVRGLTRALGREGMSAWLALPSTADEPRRNLLATSTGRAHLLSEAQSLLFAKAEREIPDAEFDDVHVTGVSASQRKAANVIAAIPPKRRRRPQ